MPTGIVGKGPYGAESRTYAAGRGLVQHEASEEQLRRPGPKPAAYSALMAQLKSGPDERRSMEQETPLRGCEVVWRGVRGLTPTPKSASRLRRFSIANARLPVETTPHFPKEGICGPRAEHLR